MDGIVERWISTAAARGYPLESWRAELLGILRGADNQRIELAAEARSYGELIEILTGKNTDRIYHAPSALGDKGIDLNFFPITPCRVLDTRFGTGAFAGVRTPGSTTTFVTNVTANIQAQGGNASGCPLPAVDAGAIAFNLTVTNNNTDGFATMFPATATLPNASTINFGPGSFPSPLANASIVQQCVTCGAGDVSVYVEGASTHVIVDVVGYFDLAPTVSCSSSFTTNVNLGNNTCVNVLSCAITNPANGRTRTVKCQASVASQIDHLANEHDEYSVRIATNGTTCDTIITSRTPGAGYFDINSTIPAGCCYHNTIESMALFTLSAGASQTYFLNVQQTLGNGAGDQLDSGLLFCELLP